eukprot:1594948-Rhodomonas_salina.1
MWDGTPTVPLIQTKASNDTDGRSEMGEWAEKLLCGEGLSRMAESVVRARAQGWVPVAAYRQEASVWHERLKLADFRDAEPTVSSRVDCMQLKHADRWRMTRVMCAL